MPVRELGELNVRISLEKFSLEKFSLEKTEVFLPQVNMELLAPQTL
jgi:hypothetical protein